MTGPYAQATLGSNISTIEVQDDAQDEAIRSFERGVTEPTIKPVGLLYDCLNSTVLTTIGATALSITEAFARWNGSTWTLYSDPTKPQINAGGTIPFAADQSMGSHKITGLAAGTNNTHAAQCGQVMLLNGSNAMTGAMNMGTHQINGVSPGTASTDAVNLSQLGTGVPSFAADMYYQTNWDVRGNSRPVVVQTQASPTTTYTNVGRVPRRMTVRLYGTFVKQSDNSDAGQVAMAGDTFTYNRWDPDSTSGEPGTDGSGGLVIGSATPVSGGAPHVDIIVIAKLTAPYGFWLKFLRSDGVWCDLKKTGSLGTRGGIQVITEQGEGS